MGTRAFEKYAREVVSKIACRTQVKKRIKEDILEMLQVKCEEERQDDPVELLGEASVLASEFSENLEVYNITSLNNKEWVSNIIIFGLPLYHIIFGNGYRVAKGILAIGPIAYGGVAIGGLSIGIISLGGVSIGMFSLGGLAVGLLASVGGAAFAYDIAIGGMAVANNFAIGGAANAKEVAIGGITSARLMLYNQSYNIPQGMNEGSVYAYDMNKYAADFIAKFEALEFGFGPVKSILTKMFSR